jgi:hypothetical protein
MRKNRILISGFLMCSGIAVLCSILFADTPKEDQAISVSTAIQDFLQKFKRLEIKKAELYYCSWTAISSPVLLEEHLMRYADYKVIIRKGPLITEHLVGYMERVLGKLPID